ncbi:metal-dependent transcriptional regulator [Cellulosilyticum sp. I15G10I2]|uniref:metal-dependent transcriptional regulator n=1 Tax=Cellulosilyticum sp. I15G10I2 TaxID=1892843 RepID=UPI000AE9614E|nr:iron dependent repressor, metal binding and dimerization domain protein [Cellulosilyticum sp. I15G10I2]
MKEVKEFHTVRGYQMLNSEQKLLTSSMEDYLEMIYRICIKEGYIRINQLALKLNVRPSSTTKIVQKLKHLGLIEYQKYAIIQLTDEGQKIGQFLLKRHEIIEAFLRKLGIEETLLKDTEMMEHDMSLNTVKSLDLFNKFLEDNPEIIEQYKMFKERCYKEISFESNQ